MKTDRLFAYLLVFALLPQLVMAGCPVHRYAHRHVPKPHTAYGKLLENNNIGDWHQSVYWGLSTPDSGHGLKDLPRWLSENEPEMPTFLPVFDPAVTVTGAWVDPDSENGPRVHSAIDFARKDGKSFQVHAIADGHVIFVGYHPSPGHVVIVEHTPINGPKFRAIYHHLRNGRDDDIRLGLRTKAFVDANPDWNEDLYSRRYQERAERAADMLRRGEIDEEWITQQWGTNEQVISVKEGDYVTSGQQIAWAGCTGMHCQNIHLHFSVARQANFVDHDWSEEYPVPGDLRWALFDPFGLYGGPEDLAAYNLDDGERQSLQHASIFGPQPVDVIGLDLDTFQEAQDYYARFNYYPINLSVEYLGDQEKLSFLPLEGPGRAEWNISTSFRHRTESAAPIIAKNLKDFNLEVVKQSYRGWRPSEIIPTTTPGGEVYYSSLLRKIDGRQFLAEPKLDPESFQIHLQELHNIGYTLANFIPYYENGELWISANWVTPDGWIDHRVVWGLNFEEFADQDKKLTEQGFQLVRMHRYATPETGAALAGVWYSGDDFAHGNYKVLDTYYLVGIQPEIFQDNRLVMESNGFEVTHLDYHDGEVSVIYKQFANPNPALYEYPLEQHFTTLGELLVTNADRRATVTLPVYGEALADSSIAPQMPTDAIVDVDEKELRFVDPATQLELPPISSLVKPVRIQAENILASCQITEGRLISQYLRNLDGDYTPEMQAVWMDATRGAIMRVPLAVPRNGSYRLKVALAQSPASGVIQFYHNGRRLGKPLNGYQSSSQPSREVIIDTIDLTQGVNYVDVRVRGKDKRSEGYQVGIDEFVLIPVK